MEIENGMEEYRDKANRDGSLRFIHNDGRRCIVGPDGIWRHWEESQGPLDDVDRVCDRQHLSELTSRSGDRGSFGMPGIGSVNSCKVGAEMHYSRHASWIDKNGVHMRYGDNGLDIEPVTDDAMYILGQLPTIMKDFLENNAKYARAQSGHDLGLKGIIPDINRKSSALITRIWDGQEFGRDKTDELITDLIGHLLLMLAKMRSE